MNKFDKIDKIVELDIKTEQLDEIFGAGVDVVSFVDEPAIQIEFEYFSKEQFVTPNAGETEEEFIPRCMSELAGEYPDQDQRLAVCYSYLESEFTCDHAFSDELTDTQKIILKWAEEFGELINENCTVISEQEQFATVTDVTRAIQGLDILSTLGIRRDEPAETKYRYTGPSAERGFCKAMLRLNKMYSLSDMEVLEDRLGVVNPGMGPGGIDTYDVFAYKGGVSCRHFWSQLAVFRNSEGRVLVIDRGPAPGNAGKSNNGASPSPAGAVGNNASLSKDFGFASIDDEKRIVAGPLMVPNTMILRRDENGKPYYVFFSKETIKRIQEKFNKYMKHNRTDAQHDGNVTENNVMLEQWIIEHPTWDKSRFYGFDLLPLGSWFAVYKVNDDKMWNDIKSGRLKGFSVAGSFIEQAKEVQQDELTLSSIIEIIKSIK